jgi:hypothetical protein
MWFRNELSLLAEVSLYIQIAIQHTKLCYSAYELNFWAKLFRKSLIRNNKINVKGYKQLITIQLHTLHLYVTWKFNERTASVKPVEEC